MKARKILVVEDDPSIRADIAECLTEFGYLVCGQAATGDEAVSLAERAEPDLVLMDIHLEGEMDGITAAGIIRSALRIPVVFLTAFADEETLSRAKITEPYGYILKPYKPLELRTVIELALYKMTTNLGATLADQEITAADSTNRIKSSKMQRNEMRSAQADSTSSAAAFEGDTSASMGKLFERMRSMEPFSLLSPEVLERILKQASVVYHTPGELIYLEGDKGVSGFIVMTGRVALVKSSSSGKDLIVDLLYPGDPFGLIVALDKQPCAFTAKAQVNSELVWIPKAVLLAALDEEPEISRAFLQKILDRLRFSHDTSRGLARERVEARIASTLVNLLEKSEAARVWQGKLDRSRVIEMTRQELADLVGSTEETTIRITKSLEREGVLDLSTPRAIKVVDRQALELLML